MPSTMEHVAALSVTIGPRGSTTEAERAAADYAAEVFRALGLTPCVEPFVSATSAWRPYAIATGGMLLMVPLFFLGGRWIAALGTFLLILCTVLELSFTPNPLRLLVPKGRSQNVYAILPPAGPVRQRVILCGHLDTHRTPWAFSSPRALALYRTLVTLGLPGAAGMGVLFGIGAWTGDPRWGWPALLPALLLAAVFAMAVQADLTPYTHGANDNATGAGMVLALAERLRREPLRHTEVWALCTGCEEVGAYGAAAFVRRHRDLGRPIFIVLDTVGGPGSGPCVLVQETMLVPLRSDPELLALAEEVARSCPELGAYRRPNFRGAYTDGAPAVRAGWRVLTLVNLRPDGVLPHWHQPSDVYENVDPGVVARTEAFVWQLLQAIDRQAIARG